LDAFVALDYGMYDGKSLFWDELPIVGHWSNRIIDFRSRRVGRGVRSIRLVTMPIANRAVQIASFGLLFRHHSVC